MQIKDLRQFRTNWKKEQGYAIENWDEHFIGSVQGQHSGFYKMVNGIVGDIKADLTPKLQNAQDEQAIYEFLQNAADCGATECAVIYDADYFMVINNGKPFSQKDMKALLNTFQGTKADKSRPENFDKIGRYGVGFKLAYRLLGKSDGVRELYEDLAGPIIFSWYKTTQFRELQQAKKGLSLKTTTNDTAPWLMKIILACFPATPDESVKGLDYQDRIVFDSTEVKQLTEFLQRHEALLKDLKLEKGSLFFLRFGHKKHEKLKTSLENLKSGIGYSLNTLKTLEKVVLQNEVIDEFPVTFEKFSIDPGTEDFKTIDPEFNFCPIELAIGIPNELEQAYSLKDAPNIYQFFPMRNELHQLGFFVHGTSFAKITDRTRLDNQGEANKETLRYLAKALTERLDEYQTENPHRYAKIYRSILVSERPHRSSRTLVTEYLYKPLLEYIQANIPTDKSNFYTKDLVILKNTNLPISPMALGIGKEWFYWADSPELIKEATDTKKLGLKKWGLKELIAEGNTDLVNKWLRKLNVDKYKNFIEELKAIRFDKKLLSKFNLLKCFKFTDNNLKSQYYSLDDLQNDPNTFVLNDKTKAIKAELKALGFSVLEFNIEDYDSIYTYLQSKLRYLANDKALYDKITERTDKRSLAMCHKQGLFKVLQPLVARKEFENLRLFRNQHDTIVPLKSLIAPSAVLPDWYEPFKVHNEEDWEALKPYYIKQDQGNLYEDVVMAHWETLTNSPSSITDFYTNIQQLYEEQRYKKNLFGKPYFFINESVGFVGAEQVFYHPALANSKNYAALTSSMQKLTDLHIPDKTTLPFLTAEPFKTNELPNNRIWKQMVQGFNQKIQDVGFNAAEKLELFLLFEKALPASDVNRLALFTNSEGELLPIKRLLPIQEDQPKWLQNYQINEREYDGALDNSLASDTEIYNQIIHPSWNDLIESEDVTVDIEAFYKYVMAAYQFSKYGRAVNVSKYIYVNEGVGFVESKQVFYHSDLTAIEDQTALSNAIYQLTDLYLPQADIVQYLGESPFKTRENTIKKAIKVQETTLSKAEVQALQAFMEATGEDFYMQLCVQVGEGLDEYIISKRGKQIPYYIESDKPQIRRAIDKVFGKQYAQVPQEIYNAKYQNKGLVEGKALFDKLSKSTDPSILAAIAEESDNEAVQAQMIQKMDKIAIKIGTRYPKHSVEHKALQVFISNPKDIETFRKKIVITDKENKVWKLADIGFSPTVTFETKEQGNYELNLAEILPRFKESYELLKTVATQFPSFEDGVLKKKVFEVVEKSHSSIFAEMTRRHKNVENASQLAFLVLFGTTNANNQKLREFMIKTKSGATKLTMYTVFHLKQTDFIKPDAVLDMASYQGIGGLLGITNKRPAFTFNNQRIAIAPYLDTNQFICTPLKRGPLSEQIVWGDKALTYLFREWKKQPLESIELFTELSQNTLYGFQPSVHFYPKNFARKQEALPDWVEKWVGSDTQKVAFLSAIGVHTNTTASVKLRQYFQQEQKTANKKITTTLQGDSTKDIKALLKWLQTNDITFTNKGGRLEGLQQLYAKMKKVDDTTPLPYIHTVENDTITYRLGDFQHQKLYLIEPKKRAKLLDKYQVNLSKLFGILKASGKKVTDIAIKDVDLEKTPIEVKLDLKTLEKYSTEWSSAYYLKWRKQARQKIFIYDGEIPFQVDYLDTSILKYTEGDSVIHKHKAYINSECDNVEEALLDVWTDTFPETVILKLLRFKNEALGAAMAKQAKKAAVGGTTSKDVLVNNVAIADVENYKKGGRLEVSLNLADLPETVFNQLKDLLKYAEHSQIKKVMSDE